MKLAVRVVLTLLFLLVGGLAVLFLLPSDVVTTKYVTVQAARDDELFGRGWLPDILPPSARDIRVSNNLDLNISEGEFFFDARDAWTLREKIAYRPNLQAPFDDWANYVEKKRKAGFEIGSYSDEESDWIFLCRYQHGKCEYVMWLRQNG
jgi:hypothetical protein